ncbi:uncharacterized protein LOC135616001 isoform X5 [Musa acuminata AAA Group]|uniref:uncharacterized protein LOC135616001 isoform X5 n=1 Tax=Musa acuminata AAA Group TaxID=214697 RepID=UPI0031E1F545
MHQQSFTVDGFFLIVKEGVDEMIKLLANEPSVGLFFVEQHARTSMPYLLGLKNTFYEQQSHNILAQNDFRERKFMEEDLPSLEWNSIFNDGFLA